MGQLVTSEQIRAARMLLRWEQKDLAEASGVSLPAVKRLEATRGPLRAHAQTAERLRQAFAAQGVEFIEEQGVIKR
jgi:transcriptional regulator with XRE-family HTH domain